MRAMSSTSLVREKRGPLSDRIGLNWSRGVGITQGQTVLKQFRMLEFVVPHDVFIEGDPEMRTDHVQGSARIRD